MSDDYETRHAVREANKIHLEDAYFDARPHHDFKINREFFGAGFDRAWDTQEVRIAELKQQRDHLESENAKQAEMLNKVIEQRDELLAAAENLIRVKGRHHTEQAYKQLEAAIAKVKPYQGLPTTGTT